MGAPMGQIGRVPGLCFYLVFPRGLPGPLLQVRCRGPCYKSGALWEDPVLLYQYLNAAMSRLL